MAGISKVPGAAESPPAVGEWLRPGLVTALAAVTFRDVTLPAGQVVRLLSQSSRRVACAFWAKSGSSVLPNLAPFGDPDQLASLTGIGAPFALFDLASYLSLVTMDWYGYTSAGQIIRVIEFTRPT